MTMNALYIGNDNTIELIDLYNEVTDAYITGATVACTLYDSDGNQVSGETWPLAMAYVGGSNGAYRAVLADTLSLTPGSYTAEITANAGAGAQYLGTFTLTAQVRTT